MSEEATPTDGTQAAPAETAPAAPAPEAPKETKETSVPLHVLQKERDERQKAEAELQELRNAEEKRQREQMSELERAQADLAKAQEEAAAAKQAAILEGRKSVALGVAANAGLNDPTDALAFLDLTALEGEEAIQGAIGELVEKRPYLKVAETGPARTSSVDGAGSPEITTPGAAQSDFFGGATETARRMLPKRD